MCLDIDYLFYKVNAMTPYYNQFKIAYQPTTTKKSLTADHLSTYPEYVQRSKPVKSRQM